MKKKSFNIVGEIKKENGESFTITEQYQLLGKFTDFLKKNKLKFEGLAK